MVISKEKHLLERLLRHSVLTLCQETITYDDTLQVDCIICVSVGDSVDQLVVKIHELLEKPSLATNGPRRTRHRHEPHAAPVATCEHLPLHDDQTHSSVKDESSSRLHDVTIKKECEEKIEHHETSTSASFDNMTTTNDDGMFADVDKSPDTNLPTTDDSDNSLNKGDDVLKATFCIKCETHFANFEEFDTHNYSVHLTHTCNYCLQTFTSRPNMYRHIRRHTGYKPYTCTICGMQFSRKDDHSIHVLKHSVAKPFVCSMCSKEYTDRSCLRSHMKREHQRRLLYLCAQCGKGFGDPSEAEQHRLVHYPTAGSLNCPKCAYVASSEEEFHNHMISHDTNSLPYHCSECNRSFANLDLYKKHMTSSLQTHNIYPCPVCSIDFPTVSDYQSHSCDRTSTQLNDQIFTYNNNTTTKLTSTQVAGNAIKRHYWCTECNLGFRVENDLKSHIESYHCSVDKEENVKRNQAPLYIDLCSTGINRRTDFPSKYNFNSELPTLIELPTNTSAHVNPRTFSVNDGAIDLSMGCKSDTFCHLSKRIQDDTKTKRLVTASSDRGIISNFSTDTLRVLKSLTEHRNTPVTTTFHEISRSPDRLSHKRRCLSLPSETFGEKLSKVTSSQQSPGSFSDSLGANGPQDSFSKFKPRSPTSLFKFQDFYRCDFCPETFALYRDYSGHCAVAHKRYVCDQCGMCFTAKPNRDRHRRYHTGEKPYACNLCDKTFFRGDDLKYHRTTRHLSVKHT